MNRRPRRWQRYGLLLGAIGAVAYARRRSRAGPSANEQRIITERHGAAFLVGRRIESGCAEAVTEDVARALTGSDPQRLLGLEGASTASLFLERGGDDPRLVWYVEVPQSVVTEWSDPQSTVADAFPVTHDALSRPDEPADRELLVHAIDPDRPRRVGACLE